jgi:tripartite-type tricarboxylate transporter receptor subunit TctC
MLAGLLGLYGSIAAAQDVGTYPSRPTRILVIFPPGGGADVATRIVAPQLSSRLGQPVFVENKPGFGGGLAMELTARANPDGYTLVLTSSGGLTALPSLYKNLTINPMKDLAPITLFGVSPLVLVARTDFAASNVKQLIALAKKKPGQLSYGSGGSGTAPHLAGELFKSMSGTDLLHIPFKGSSPAVAALLGGSVDLAFADMGTVRPYLGNGLKAIGVLGAKRTPLAPEIPTFNESGLPGYDAEGWFALMAPAATPPAIVAKLNKYLVEILGSTEVKARFSTAAIDARSSTPAELAQKIKADTARWSKIITAAGIKPD